MSVHPAPQTPGGYPPPNPGYPPPDPGYPPPYTYPSAPPPQTPQPPPFQHPEQLRPPAQQPQYYPQPPAHLPPIVQQPQNNQSTSVSQQQSNTNIVMFNQPERVIEVRRDIEMILGSALGHRTWSTDLCSCCENCGTCCKTMICPTCVLANIASRLEESCLVAYCVPGGTCILRTRLRTLGGIKGSVIGDCSTTAMCPLCVLCQMEREMSAMGL